MKTWAIGDVHGCRDTLYALLAKLGQWDKLIFLGDYIDRGENSKGVIDIVRGLQEDVGHDKVIALKGNHEDMCLHYYNKYDWQDYELGRAWGYNGANETLKSFGYFEHSDREVKIPNEYLNWMLELPLMYEDENAYYVHAGFCPRTPVDKQLGYDMMWIRYNFIDSNHDFGKPVIHGHTAMEKHQINDVRVSIDTACVYGFSLTAYCPETKEIISVDCIDKPFK